MRPPTIGLAIALPDDPLLERFLAIVARWCTLKHADAGEPVDAWIVTDSAESSLITTDAPVLVWTRHPQRVAGQTWPEDAILIGPGAPDGLVGEHRNVSVPEPAVDASIVPFVPPLIRRRWRSRFGLPSDLVVGLDEGASPDLPDHLRTTALAVAAVAVATGDGVLSALSWGAPTVTDLQTARRLGLGPAVKAVEADHLSEAASELTQSEEHMAELAWTGRRLVEESFDLAGAAYRAVQVAGLQPGEDNSHGVLSRLNELSASPETAWSIIHEIGK
jgi:hypothetical protein